MAFLRSEGALLNIKLLNGFNRLLEPEEKLKVYGGLGNDL